MTLNRRTVAVLGSLALHAAVGLWLVTRPPEVARVAAPEVVQIAIVVPTPSREVKTEPPAPAAGSDEGTKKRPARERKPAKPSLSEGTVPVVADEEPPSTTGTVTAERPAGRLDSVDLNIHAGAEEPPWERTRPDRAGPSGGSGGGGDEGESSGAGGRLRSKSGGRKEYEDSTFYGHIERDGTVEFEDKPFYDGIEVGPNEEGDLVVKIPFDATDAILRALGDDPYSTQKLKFLAETKELRGQMAEAACKEDLSESLLAIGPRLRSIWKNSRLPLADKRRRIFDLWDECAESGSPDVLRTSEQIRATILEFIAEHMPPDSALAYSAMDLELLNQERKSTAEFLPYGSRDAGP